MTCVAFLIFIWHQARAQYSVLDFSLFRYRNFAAGTITMVALSIVFYGSLVLLPMWFQMILDYPAFQAGVALVPRGLGTLFGLLIIGRLLEHFSPRSLICFGLTLGSFSLHSISRLSADAGSADFFWPQVLQGTAFSMLWIPLIAFTMTNIPKDKIQDATSIYGLVRNLGGASGIAISTAFIQVAEQQSINIIGTHITPFNRVAQMKLRYLRDARRHLHLADFIRLFARVRHEASSIAFTRTFGVFGFLFLIVAVAVFLIDISNRK